MVEYVQSPTHYQTLSTLKHSMHNLMRPVWLGFSCWAILLVISCELLAVTPSQSQVSLRPANTVKVLGDFKNIKFPGDDAFGYSLQLWKEGDQIFGLLAIFTGAPADPPTGLLEDVKFDSRTRQFSFSARLSTGWVHSGGNWNTRTRDRFSFRGVLTRNEVTGILKRTDDLRPTDQPTSKRIRLRRSKRSTQDMNPPPPTYADWKIWADKILRFRGPKW